MGYLSEELGLTIYQPSHLAIVI